LENFTLRAMMQLAARIITHKESLPFWNGLIAAGEGPEKEKIRFHVPPRPENKLTDEKVLEHLTKVAGNIRFHFKAFQDLAYRIERHLEDDSVGGHCAGYCPRVKDSAPGFAQLAALLIFAGDAEKPSFSKEQLEAIFEPEDDKEPESDGEECDTALWCVWRDGKPTVQDTPFAQIWLNLNHMPGYDMSNDDWQKMTISELRTVIVLGATKICHEFSHAVTNIYFPDLGEPYMNTDNIAEAGFAFESYIFGGSTRPGQMPHQNWPCYLMVSAWPNYSSWKVYDRPLELNSFGKAAVPDAAHFFPRPFRWERFLEQGFWDESETRYNSVKKLWLRSGEVLYENITIAADETPEAPPRGTRVRLTPAELEDQRFIANRNKRREAMEANKARWDRYCDEAEDRKKKFIDNGGLRVFDEAWAWCTKHYDERVFL
jgi:hypothetical protein